MNINKVLNVGDVLNVKYFISTGKEVDLRAHNIGEQRLKKLKKNIFQND